MAARMPRSVSKISQACSLCPARIKPGMRIGKDFATGQWVHLGCLVRKVNDNRASGAVDPQPAPPEG